MKSQVCFFYIWPRSLGPSRACMLWCKGEDQGGSQWPWTDSSLGLLLHVNMNCPHLISNKAKEKVTKEEFPPFWGDGAVACILELYDAKLAHCWKTFFFFLTREAWSKWWLTLMEIQSFHNWHLHHLSLNFICHWPIGLLAKRRLTSDPGKLILQLDYGTAVLNVQPRITHVSLVFTAVLKPTQS